jgi:hypothetical protein
MTAKQDLFTPIHKALRSMLYSLSGRLQTNDFADLAQTGALMADLEHDFEAARSAGCTLCFLNHHAVDEETAIFPATKKVGERLVGQLIEEHHELTRRELEIAKAGHALLEMPSADARVRAGVRLNQSANELFAAYIAHMNREETELVPLMQEHFTDEEMIGMRSAIMGALPRERMFFILEWMLPSLNTTELSGFVASLPQGAPPPFVKAVVDLCAAKVDPVRWSEVKTRVGI